MRARPQQLSEPDAEILALKALAFLAGEPTRLVDFLRLTGVDPQELQRRAQDRATLAAVLDHLMGDQSLLLVFAAELGLPAERVVMAHAKLCGNQ